MCDLDQLTIQEISQRLNNTASATTHDLPVARTPREYRYAGVLIPFVRHADSWHILYIRRAELDRDRHSGQVAFAGGKYEDADENLIATALRETHEEIGVAPNDVTVLGQLSYHHSISHYRITPVVGHIPWPYQLTLQRSEVGRTFTIPLKWLADPDNHELRYRTFDAQQKPAAVAYFNEYDGELLWGATARMTLSLISRLTAT